MQLRTAAIGTTQKITTVHLQIEDTSGDVAILEYIDGEMQIHHSREFCVMTNSPIFDEQLENLKKYDGFGGNEPLPGTTQAADRFVRAAYYLKHLRPPETTLQAVAGIISVLRNAAQPFGTSDPKRPNISPTIWRTATDHTNMVYYFESSTSPYLVWIDLKTLDFSPEAQVLRLPLSENNTFIGKSNDKLVPTPPFVWMMP
jgi:choloylglycine hydrolase